MLNVERCDAAFAPSSFPPSPSFSSSFSSSSPVLFFSSPPLLLLPSLLTDRHSSTTLLLLFLLLAAADFLLKTNHAVLEQWLPREMALCSPLLPSPLLLGLPLDKGIAASRSHEIDQNII